MTDLYTPPRSSEFRHLPAAWFIETGSASAHAAVGMSGAREAGHEVFMRKKNQRRCSSGPAGLINWLLLRCGPAGGSSCPLSDDSSDARQVAEAALWRMPMPHACVLSMHMSNYCLYIYKATGYCLPAFGEDNKYVKLVKLTDKLTNLAKAQQTSNIVIFERCCLTTFCLIY